MWRSAALWWRARELGSQRVDDHAAQPVQILASWAPREAFPFLVFILFYFKFSVPRFPRSVLLLAKREQEEESNNPCVRGPKMEKGAQASDSDSDETMIEGSVTENELEDEELPWRR